MSIKELRDWGLIHSKPILGRRKEHFTADKDPWEILLQVMAERRKREFDPTAAALRHCRELAESEPGPESQAALTRLTELSDVLESLLSLHDAVEKLPRPLLKKLVKGGGALSLLKKS